MYARNVDQRSAIFQKALEVGEAYQLRTKVGDAVVVGTGVLCYEILYIIGCCSLTNKPPTTGGLRVTMGWADDKRGS